MYATPINHHNIIIHNTYRTVGEANIHTYVQHQKFTIQVEPLVELLWGVSRFSRLNF